MRILGIDASTTATGVAILEFYGQGERPTLLDWAVIRPLAGPAAVRHYRESYGAKPPTELLWYLRSFTTVAELRNWVEGEIALDGVGCEQSYAGGRASTETYAKLYTLITMIHKLAWFCHVPFTLITPSAATLAFLGPGSTMKRQEKKAVVMAQTHEFFGNTAGEHVADAIAVAYGAYNHFTFTERKTGHEQQQPKRKSRKAQKPPRVARRSA